jgi:hypothetical protein
MSLIRVYKVEARLCLQGSLQNQNPRLTVVTAPHQQSSILVSPKDGVIKQLDDSILSSLLVESLAYLT